jgi:hypothetical protein
MKDKDTKMLFEAYSKVYIKENFTEHEVDLEIGNGGPEDEDVDRASVIEVNGQKYIVAGNVNVVTKQIYKPADRQTNFPSGYYYDGILDSYVFELHIQTTELVPVKDGTGRQTEDYKYVYDMEHYKVIKDILNNPEVVKAATEELKSRAKQIIESNPEAYDKPVDDDDDGGFDEPDWDSIAKDRRDADAGL